ncbi:2299_t:CDS:2 [Funneliformis mosseae]|uniref:2299_t:CDS:1 n=1 Tax=Funneliformis mosseae TaxID=27381 RepID=A0A9N9B6T9_FUNMO|nr:2299_t:CDS:2 [Funneliformis mosseae]
MLFCLILGDAIRNAFLVRTNKNKTVSDLRKDIWKEISNDLEGAYKLILFKVDIPVNDDTDPGSKILADNIKNQQELLPVRMVESYFKEDEDYIFFDEIPNNTDIRIIIQLPTEFANNRIKLVDNTTKFFDELLRPFNEEVSRDNVEQLLSKPLLLKLPCLPDLVVDPNVLESLFSSPIYSSRLSAIVAVVMSRNFKEGPGKEGITMGNIDSHINILIELIQEYARGCSNMSLDRNQAIQSSTTTTENKKYRPDIAVYYNRVLVMMGDAKDINTKLEAAETQLDGYFDYWNPLAFGRLPFVMAFAAAGTTLQFYYYYPGNYKPERVKIGDIIDLGTTNRLNNYKALQYIINFVRIVQTWNCEQYLQVPKIKLFEVIRRKNDTTITITPQKIIKKVHIEDRGPYYKDFFENFYTRIFPNLGGKYVVLQSKFYVKWIYLKFTPVGYLTIPKDENELRDAIWDVLNVVNNLHANRIVHRDIRWDNILRLTNDGWILIDFEEAAPIGRGNLRTPTLNITAPEYRGREDLCQVSGDIWMIGNLFDDCRIRIQLSESARKFRDKLLRQNPAERPTASGALEDNWFKGME